MNQRTCCLCGQIRGDATNDLLAQIVDSDNYIRRVVLESEAFAVIPSVGPLVSGHVLLCPKLHFRSFAQIPSTLEAEFAAMKNRLAALLLRIYGQPVHCFEHGSAKGTDQPMCTVEHAHLHLVPTDVEIWSHIKHRFEWEPVKKGMTNLTELAGDMEYLWYESPESFSVVAKGIEGTFESQFLRKIFAKALGLGNAWNWREFPRVEILSDTYTKLGQRSGVFARS